MAHMKLAIPSVKSLADLYRQSLRGDRFLAGVAEAAAFRVAVAEAALAEAAVLVSFAEAAGISSVKGAR